MTPTEFRQRLAVTRDRAISAGLLDVVRRADASLMIAAHLAISALEKALAENPAAEAHAEIVQALDTPDPESMAASIPPPRRPGVTPPPASTLTKAKPAGRKPTGPDKYDLEIPV